MSEDLTHHTIELPNGLRLSYPSNLDRRVYYTSRKLHVYVIDPQDRAYLLLVYPQDIDGLTSNNSNEDGLNQVLEG